MLNRRHIRVKVMQSIYAMHQNSSDNLEKEEKFLFYSIENIQDLYLIMLSSLVEIKRAEEDFIDKSSKKHLATKEERNPNKKFVSNAVLEILSENNSLSIALEDRKINNWKNNDDYILILLEDIKNSKLYADYMHNDVNDFEEDKQFVEDIFTEIIAPNEKLYDYLEDNKLTWVDDIPLVNTAIQKQLKQIKDTNPDAVIVPKLYKDIDDKEFVRNLFRKTILNNSELTKEFIDKTPNWDAERIAEIDAIILKMAICEFLKFPSIPVKVTINEYLEIAKEYSTPKSSIFINGILDNLVKDYQKENKLIKTGRGLM
ncbi:MULTISPECIES: transcription antitermination factor NusB [unclassified Flavobacterium]|uniref:transcription antitermination factor NusB n=1 Tax=unclassified Flavobacterium TaxID=196869 RepID=UPI000969D6B5|nr:MULTISPECIES: transcription antitermination factor NusB [unclassified Flavobacterium]MBN9286124.1 transcription antitermination factor NusB [Flavobacterium sp.]OJV68354.1 MAG: transcription antitermination factor NusB [Flavobacterium sp. 40-81]